MPNRIIKETITTSTTLAAFDDGTERHFWRLLVQADDFGYLDARQEVIRARAYPLMLAKVSEKESERRTQALAESGLLHLFFTGGKRYGHFPTWSKHQQKRALYGKYPQVTSCDSICNQGISDSPETYIRDNRIEKRDKDNGASADSVLPEWIDAECWKAYLAHRTSKRAKVTEKARSLLLDKLTALKAAGDDPNEVLRRSIMNGWTGIFPLAEGSKNGTARQHVQANTITPKTIYHGRFDADGKPILGHYTPLQGVPG